MNDLSLRGLVLHALWCAANIVLVSTILNATGWHSWVPALFACVQLMSLERVASPRPYLLAIAIAACVVVIIARAPRWRGVRLTAFILCSPTTTALHANAYSSTS